MAARRHDRRDDERDRRNARAGNIRTMIRSSRSWEFIFACMGLSLFVVDGSATAADMPVKAPYIRSVFDWTGLYVGVQAGYSYQLPSGMLLGVEADISFPNYLTSNSVVSSLATARSDVTEQWDYVGTARGRVGYVAGPWLVYATGGLAWAGERFLNTPAIGSDEKTLHTRLGWAAGGGVEYAFAPHWSLRLEYLYSQFGNADIKFPSATQYTSKLDFQALRL